MNSRLKPPLLIAAYIESNKFLLNQIFLDYLASVAYQDCLCLTWSKFSRDKACLIIHAMRKPAIAYAKTKVQISCTGHVQLIIAFILAR